AKGNVNGANGGSNSVAVVAVVGAAGNLNANLNWGPGYVGGGDIGTVMKIGNPNNLSIAYLSIADAKSLTGTTWSQVLPFEGIWPTGQGAGIAGAVTNDYSTITSGMYPCWG